MNTSTNDSTSTIVESSADTPPNAPAATRSLPDLRDAIERVDASLIALMAERQALARDVGMYKRANGQAVLDPGREVAVVARAASLAREHGLPDDEVRAVFWRLIGISRRAQLELPKNTLE